MATPNRRTLSQALDYRLMRLIDEEYKTSGKNDVEFALYANEKLGVELINNDHIRNRRVSLGIPNFSPQIPLELLDLAALEKRIVAIEAWIAKTGTP